MKMHRIYLRLESHSFAGASTLLRQQKYLGFEHDEYVHMKAENHRHWMFSLPELFISIQRRCSSMVLLPTVCVRGYISRKKLKYLRIKAGERRRLRCCIASPSRMFSLFMSHICSTWSFMRFYVLCTRSIKRIFRIMKKISGKTKIAEAADEWTSGKV